MKGFRFLEVATTRYFVISLAAVVIAAVLGFASVLTLRLTDVETLATFVDAVFKTIAMLAAALWALNRHYMGRTDAPQLRVDADVSAVSAKRFPQTTGSHALLICRLEVINTGKTLIEPYQQFLEVHAVVPANNTVEYAQLWRWPKEGTHSGSPIEPGSWSAISQVIPIPSEMLVVRIYLELTLSNGTSWTWHKLFDVSSSDAY